MHSFFADYCNNVKELIRTYTDHRPFCEVVKSRVEPKCVRVECTCGLDRILNELGLDIGPGRRR